MNSNNSRKKTMWKAEEDMLLKSYIETHGEGNWAAVSKKLGLRRGGKSCRLRWRNYLRPDIKHGRVSEDEQDIIIRMHKLLGNRWALIAGRLPGRTDNEVKNYWNTYLSKKTRIIKTKDIITETPTDEVDVAIEDKLISNNQGNCTEEEAMADVANKGEFSSADLSGEIGGGQGSGAGNPSCAMMDMHMVMENYDDQFMMFGDHYYSNHLLFDIEWPWVDPNAVPLWFGNAMSRHEINGAAQTR